MIIKTSDGIDLCLTVSGEGSPCIFVHGGPGAWSYSFEELGGRDLEDTFQMIYFDQRGCGRSSGSSNDDY